jgi:hypothetical protein
MTLFPWLAVVILLALLAALLVEVGGATGRARRRERPLLARPGARMVLLVLLAELALLVAWTLLGRPLT